MKYMIMMFCGLGEAVRDRSPEWVAGMHRMLQDMDAELRERGELVAGASLMDPANARTVRFTDGAAVATDGPYAEVKESLAGYWIVTGTEERALEIAERVVDYTHFPMEVRRLMDHTPPPPLP
jgi:hypothetical protein